MRKRYQEIGRKNHGFTLAELLIVVAIIGVLVAVSIPIFTAQIEKAREATDIANMRAAKAVAIAAYLGGDFPNQDLGGSEPTISAWYDPATGTLDSYYGAADTGYGTTANPSGRKKEDVFNETGFEYDFDGDMTEQRILVTIESSSFIPGELLDDFVGVSFDPSEVDFDDFYIDNSDGSGYTEEETEEDDTTPTPTPAP